MRGRQKSAPGKQTAAGSRAAEEDRGRGSSMRRRRAWLGRQAPPGVVCGDAKALGALTHGQQARQLLGHQRRGDALVAVAAPHGRGQRQHRVLCAGQASAQQGTACLTQLLPPHATQNAPADEGLKLLLHVGPHLVAWEVDVADHHRLPLRRRRLCGQGGGRGQERVRPPAGGEQARGRGPAAKQAPRPLRDSIQSQAGKATHPR